MLTQRMDMASAGNTEQNSSEQENRKGSRKKQLQIPTRLVGVETRRNKDQDFHTSTSASGTYTTSVDLFLLHDCFFVFFSQMLGGVSEIGPLVTPWG